MNQYRNAILRILAFGLIFLFFTNASYGQKKSNVVEAKINSLIAKMTLAEKLGQLQQLDGEANGKYRPEYPEMLRKGLLGSTLNVRGAKMVNELQRSAMQSRLKIPNLFAFDVVHGYRTMFQIPLGEAASFDPDSARLSASIAAKEARAAGVAWTFAPMVDIARDPRWGRIMEGAGEDPYLGSLFAKARVEGFQGNDYSANDRVLACAKHWVGYGAALAGRDYSSTDIPEYTLRNVYFLPFKAAVDAGAGAFMSAFNELNGVPTSANRFTLTDVLRGEWKFDGFVVSDYTSVMELINHGFAANESDAAQLALNAGVDMEMVSRLYNRYGETLTKDRRLKIAVIDEAVRRVLRVKFRLGLFDKPFVDETIESRTILAPEHRKIARELATKSFVLLKNDGNTLPISKSVKSIAVIGALADSKKDMNAAWAGDGDPNDPVTLLAGLKNRVGSSVKINYAVGCDAKCETESGFTAAVEAAKASDFVIVTLGEDADMSGEAAVRSNIDLPGRQEELLKAVHAVGKPYALVLMNGRPLTINWAAENSPAVLETWLAGTEAGNAITDVLFGYVNPSGKLPITFPRSVGQIPIFYNEMNTGRPFEAANKYTSKYLDAPNTPLYPFGFGLSYTTFELSPTRLSDNFMSRGGMVTATATLTNTGNTAGTEVVQLYIRDVAASMTRPVRELKGIQRVSLNPGESKQIAFQIGAEQIGFYTPNGKYTIEPGEFKVWIANSSITGTDASFVLK